MSPEELAARSLRLQKVNELVVLIANVGRRFLRHNDKIGRMATDCHGRLRWIDPYNDKNHYLHAPPCYLLKKDFSEGGTMRQLVIDLRDFVLDGKQMNRYSFGPYPLWMSGGDPWGYSMEDMSKVRDKAIALGIVSIPATPAVNPGLRALFEDG